MSRRDPDYTSAFLVQILLYHVEKDTDVNIETFQLDREGVSDTYPDQNSLFNIFVGSGCWAGGA